MNFIKEDMPKYSEVGVFICNGEKKPGMEDLESKLKNGYTFVCKTKFKETAETYGGVLFILGKNEDLETSN